MQMLSSQKLQTTGALKDDSCIPTIALWIGYARTSQFSRLKHLGG
jgi:hypothetical protein